MSQDGSIKQPQGTDDLTDRIAGLSPAKRALLDLTLKKNGSIAYSEERISRRTHDGSAPLSFAQQRLWFLDQLEPGNPTYNMPAAFRLKGLLHVAALEQSLNEIIRRHASLRTTFSMVDGEPVQVIAPSEGRSMAVVDLRDYPEGEREEEARRRVREEAGRPFNLARGPLFRSKLLRLGEDDHVLLLTMHHIVSDGWSMGLLYHELSMLYRAFVNGEPSPLSELPIQYADFAVWQREWLQGSVLANQISYWKKQLDNLSTLQLPTDWPRPAVQTYRGARESVLLAKDLSGKLKALSRKESVTPFMTLLAAFQILMHRYTGQDDIAVGSPIAGRNRCEIEGLIGFFLNTLVMRTDVSGNPTFVELLARVRKMALDVYAHQDLPFERLVEELQPQRNLSRTPVFQVFFNMLTLDDRGLKLDGLTVEQFGHADPHSKFDLTLYVREQEQRIGFALVYNADLFCRPRMVEMLGQFVFLLEQIVETPGLRIEDFSLVTPRAKPVLPNPAQSLGSNGFVPVSFRFSEQARRVPDRPAVVDSKAIWSYEELELRSNQLANYLIAAGIRSQETVAVYADRSASLVWALLGVLKAGAAFVILDPAYPASRLIDYTRAANAKGWLEIDGAKPAPEVLEEFARGLFCRVRARLPSLAAARQSGFLDGYPTVAPAISVDPDDRAYIAFTSGSTGKPKGIVGPHGPLSHFFDWHIRQFGLTQEDRFSLLSGLSYDPCLRDIFTPLLLGAKLFVPSNEQMLSNDLGHWLKRVGVSVAHATPAMGYILTDDPSVQCDSLRYVFFGGDTLTEELLVKTRRLAPAVTCVNFYGTTETPQAVGYYVVSIPAELTAVNGAAALTKTIPLGRGIDDAQLLILNRGRNLAGVGEQGEICVRSPFLSGGYLDDQEKTLERFQTNPFTSSPGDLIYRTGDLGRYLPDGAVEFAGRADRQVKVRGHRIELGEIECAMERHAGVRQAVVVVREIDSQDQRLEAHIVPQAEQLTIDQLRTFLQKSLPSYMVPSSFVVLDHLPLTPNGKVDRSALPAPDYMRQEQQEALVAPRDGLELQLRQIWEKLLKVRPIGIRDNFFDLGGHSLLAVRLFAQIEKVTGKRLPVAALFHAPTIEQLTRLMSRQEWSAQWKSLVAIQPAGSKPPFFCVHAHDGGVLFWRDLARHLGSDQPLYALQAQGLNGRQPPHNRIDEMAAHYIKEIRALQPEGPYFIGGHCIGGLIAFEMAQQLHTQGERVGLLALFDSYAPRKNWSARSSMLHRYRYKAIRLFEMTVSLHVSNLLILEPKERLSYVKGKFNKALYKLYMGLGSAWVPAARHRQNILKAGSRASRNYDPKIYPGKIALFRATNLGGGIEHDPQMGWGRLAGGGLETHVIPGYHAHIVLEPRVRVLAEKLTACLERGQAGALSTKENSPEFAILISEKKS